MYSLIIPPALIKSMFDIREKTGVSIRKQILIGIDKQIKEAINDIYVFEIDNYLRDIKSLEIITEKDIKKMMVRK